MIALLLAACSGADVEPPGDDDDGPTDSDTDTDTPPMPTASTSDTMVAPKPTTPSTGPVVVMAIGDGMGFEHVLAGSLYATGTPDGLRMQALPISGTARTASLTGIGDSAAGGTALACGARTYNDVIGLDRDGAEVENLVELARSLGWATGVVTTSELPHATPAVFTAHHENRDEELVIAGKQVPIAADVMLGGGTTFYAELHDEIRKAGFDWVDTPNALAKATGPRVWGAFAPNHLQYEASGPSDPRLPELVTDAIARLEPDPEGFFLMIEGARIDHASHGTSPDLMVAEVAAFDEAIAEVLDWATATGRELTLVVTADHECGGLEVEDASSAKGAVPDVSWRWGNHTNEDVPIFAMGPGTATFDGQLVDNREIHARLVEQMTGTYTAPETELLADGRHDDLTHRASVQINPSSVGDTLARLEALELDADERGLAIGIEGVFPWLTHTLVILLDVDFGTGTGATNLTGTTSGATTFAEAVVDRLTLGDVPAGFGTDFVLVSIGGAETPYAGVQRGFFGLRAPWGDLADVDPHRAAMNFGPDTRARSTEPQTVAPGLGFETVIEWPTIFPKGLPAGTEVAVFAVLTTIDGSNASNQMLPPLSLGSPAPGTTPFDLPGVVVFPIDPDADGIVSPSAPYTIP